MRLKESKKAKTADKSAFSQKPQPELLASEGREISDLLSAYLPALTLLEQYDSERLTFSRKGRARYKLTYEEVKPMIAELRKGLSVKKLAGGLFGQEYGDKFRAILGNIYQTFGGKELYLSLEEKAANLLYFLVKDHPFADGNKRIAAFLFVYFLHKNNYLYDNSGEMKIDNNALVPLVLLMAISSPKEKEAMVKIVTNLIK